MCSSVQGSRPASCGALTAERVQVACNIGNPQQLGQKPLTFMRQVLSICDYPPVQSLHHAPWSFAGL